MPYSEGNEKMESVAIIGMAGRFPGSQNIQVYWNNLVNGVNSISFLNEELIEKYKIDAKILNHPNFVKSRGGVLEKKDSFDFQLSYGVGSFFIIFINSGHSGGLKPVSFLKRLESKLRSIE